jgi:hypothetical protein
MAFLIVAEQYYGEAPASVRGGYGGAVSV